jgi:hypothetical protein
MGYRVFRCDGERGWREKEREEERDGVWGV